MYGSIGDINDMIKCTEEVILDHKEDVSTVQRHAERGDEYINMFKKKN